MLSSGAPEDLLLSIMVCRSLEHTYSGFQDFASRETTDASGGYLTDV